MREKYKKYFEISEEEEKLYSKLSYLQSRQQTIRSYRNGVLEFGSDESKKQFWSEWFKVKRAIELLKTKIKQTEQAKLTAN